MQGHWQAGTQRAWMESLWNPAVTFICCDAHDGTSGGGGSTGSGTVQLPKRVAIIGAVERWPSLRFMKGPMEDDGAHTDSSSLMRGRTIVQRAVVLSGGRGGGSGAAGRTFPRSQEAPTVPAALRADLAALRASSTGLSPSNPSLLGLSLPKEATSCAR